MRPGLDDGVPDPSAVGRAVRAGGLRVQLHVPAAVLDRASRLHALVRHGQLLPRRLALRQLPRRLHGVRRLLPPRQHPVWRVAGSVRAVRHGVRAAVRVGSAGAVRPRRGAGVGRQPAAVAGGGLHTGGGR